MQRDDNVHDGVVETHTGSKFVHDHVAREERHVLDCIFLKPLAER